MYVPSGFPGFRPSFLNSSVRYFTVFSSPGVPGARPSNSSDASVLMCRSKSSPEILARAYLFCSVAIPGGPGVSSLEHAASNETTHTSDHAVRFFIVVSTSTALHPCGLMLCLAERAASTDRAELLRTHRRWDSPM